jgi:hypothetical protein
MDIVQELRKEIARLQRALNVLEPSGGSVSSGKSAEVGAVPKKRRKMSASARRKISLAQKARWAKVAGKK